LPNILKRFFQPKVDAYVFPTANELEVGDEAAETAQSPKPPESSKVFQTGGMDDGPSLFSLPELEEGDDFPPDVPLLLDASNDGAPDLQEELQGDVFPMEDVQASVEPPQEEAAKPKGPIDYAKVQANAMLEDARREAEEYKARAREEAEEELELLRRTAREDGYHRGYTEGMAEAAKETQKLREQQAQEQIQAVQDFLKEAVWERNKILDDAREELKDLALTVAEKVIRVSLRGSTDILRRMVETATDKRKRCEWAHIYLADCDTKGSVNTIPELTAALSHISDRVRVIPMADDESGTCIIEMPDEIMDASVSTQLGNIKEVLGNSSWDEE